MAVCWILAALFWSCLLLSSHSFVLGSAKRRPLLVLAASTKDPWLTRRSAFLRTTTTWAALTGLLVPLSANTFEGGIGGLGKTKPNTGVVFFGESLPVQNNAGQVSAELDLGRRPVRVDFVSPWPLLPTTAGLETRDLQASESAFCVVVDGVKDMPNKASFKDLLLRSVLSQQGKFGAYGAPSDVKVKATESPNIFSVTFTTLTPGLRESERQVLIAAELVDEHAILLVVGSTRQRFKERAAVMQSVAESFAAYPAPATQLR